MESQDNNYNGAERRKYPRINFIIVAYTDSKNDSLANMSATKNISAGGLCIFVDKEVAKDTVLSLKITLPNGNPPIDAKGKVVWNRPCTMAYLSKAANQFEVGIEFLDMKESDREAVAKYVTANSDKE
ncbi:MAG: PilZ domain-containing protein [Candidatus Omnitrophota bacterium]